MNIANMLENEAVMVKPVTNIVRVSVPATSANLGSGFDTAGIALAYADHLTFTLDEVLITQADRQTDAAVRVIIHGEGEHTLARDETHLVVSSFRKACRLFGLPALRFTLEAQNNIPQARGLGSSAEAIVAGVAAAWAFAYDGELSRETIFEIAAGIEGHPDNVAPAVFGGLTLSWKLSADEDAESLGLFDCQPVSSGFHTVRYDVADDIRVSVFVPDCELATQRARQALPDNVPYRDAVFNVARASLLPAAFADHAAITCAGESRNTMLLTATCDALHQSYRAHLMPQSWSLVQQLRAARFAAAISGAGPSVAVFHTLEDTKPLEDLALRYQNLSSWRVLHVDVDRNGVRVERGEY